MGVDGSDNSKAQRFPDFLTRARRDDLFVRRRQIREGLSVSVEQLALLLRGQRHHPEAIAGMERREDPIVDAGSTRLEPRGTQLTSVINLRGKQAIQQRAQVLEVDRFDDVRLEPRRLCAFAIGALPVAVTAMSSGRRPSHCAINCSASS
jgi:hypothetical protein